MPALPKLEKLTRLASLAAVTIAEINGTTNRRIHIQKILFPFAGLNSTKNTPYTVTVTSFTFKSLSLPTCDKFFVSFALRVLSKRYEGASEE